MPSVRHTTMFRPARHSQGKEIMELFKKLDEEGTTIVQVTHSETNAAYGHRVIQLADGWIVGGSVKTVG
jgi:ABC-type lipoprotein export system ATPase subunit